MVQESNALIEDNFEAAHREEIQRRVEKEAAYDQKTVGNEDKILKANRNLTKLKSDLRHHVLASQYNSQMDADGNFFNPKYIDIRVGAIVEANILGDELLGQEPAAKPESADSDLESSSEGSGRKKQPNLIEGVPLLFRLVDCKVRQTYAFTIKQFSKTQQPRSTAGSTGPRKCKFIKKIRCADLSIYVSNAYGSPCREKHDKFIFHNNIKDTSKVTQFTFFNRDPQEGINPLDDQASDSDDSSSRKKNYIYFSVRSRMGCTARIQVLPNK